jgi:hypothetical protein
MATQAYKDTRLIKDAPHLCSDVFDHVLPSLRTWIRLVLNPV